MTSADVINAQISPAEHELLEFEQVDRIALRQSPEGIEADHLVVAPPGNGHRRRHTARRSGGRRRRSAAGLTRGRGRRRRAWGGPRGRPGARGSVGEARGARERPEFMVDGGGLGGGNRLISPGSGLLGTNDSGRRKNRTRRSS